MNNIQAMAGWKTHTPNDGSNIGGVQPDNWGWWSGPPISNTAAMLAVEGPAYATVEAYILLPPIPSRSLRMSFDLTVDGRSLLALELIETDLLRLDGKTKRNHSLQRFFGKGIQIADVNGNWAGTGINSPMPLAGVPMRHEVYYATDPAGRYGTQAFVQDGALHLVAPELQSLVPQPCNWTAGEMIQFQLTLGNAPERAYIIIDNLTLEAA